MKNNPYYDYTFTQYEYSSIHIPVEPNKNSFSTYQNLLPVQNIDTFTLGEGNTPLTKASNLGKVFGFENIFIKHEELNPTGSFKDRESVIAVALAKQKKLKQVVIASSGNAALSLAAYCKKAKIHCHCFVPSTTASEKKALIHLFGGTVHEVHGNYEHVYRYVADHFDKNINFTPGICADRIEGNKTTAFEIFEEIGVPNVIVVPCGNGGNLAGIWKGFFDLKKLKAIQSIPRMIAVQIAGASPLLHALQQHQSYVAFPNTIDSIAEGIIAEESYCSPKAIRAIQSSQGYVTEVTDSMIVRAMQLLADEESLLIEPTAAAAFAALPHLSRFGVHSTAKIVVISTGSGTKMLDEIKKLIK